MASFVHSLRQGAVRTFNIAKKFRKLKRQKPHIYSSQPRVGSDTRANYKTAYSVYLVSDDPEMPDTTDIYIFNHDFWILFFFINLSYSFIYLIDLPYTFIYFFHLFIIFRQSPSAVHHPTSASAVRFLVLQTPHRKTNCSGFLPVVFVFVGRAKFQFSVLLLLSRSSPRRGSVSTFWIQSCCVCFCRSIALKEFVRDSDFTDSIKISFTDHEWNLNEAWMKHKPWTGNTGIYAAWRHTGCGYQPEMTDIQLTPAR